MSIINNNDLIMKSISNKNSLNEAKETYFSE